MAARSRRTVVRHCWVRPTCRSASPNGWPVFSAICGSPNTVADQLAQRIFGIALRYEDLIDHDQLRFDPALTAVLDKLGGRLAGKSTPKRLEHASLVLHLRQAGQGTQAIEHARHTTKLLPR